MSMKGFLIPNKFSGIRKLINYTVDETEQVISLDRLLSYEGIVSSKVKVSPPLLTH